MDKYILNDYEPQSMFHFFEDLAAIPHGSKNEKAVADYLEAFATERNLEFFRDDLNNILIKKPATPGYEAEDAILLQGHTDMVCEKNAGTVHDFATDPLELYVEGGQLHANGTTLGADDGIAVAVMLALLDGEALEHPALECLFTVSEEIGLIGAENFDFSHVTARKMINMDSEGEGIAVVGCAGGCRTDIKIPVEYVAGAGEALTLRISGLMGGHSGSDINLGRANANKLMGRLLLSLRRDADYNLISINGGLMDNAIPRECEAIITCADGESMKSRAIRTAAEIASELNSDDAGFKLTCIRIDTPERMMNCASTRLVAEAIGTIENGIMRMSADVVGLVEFSRNIGIVSTEDEYVIISCSTRSAVEHQIDASIDYLNAFAELCGGSAEHYGRYPGWKYSKISPLREKYLKVAREILGRDVGVLAIHAGLECGIIKSRVPDMDIISIGPDMFNIHTPDESLDLESFARFWKIVSRLLRK